MGKVSCGCGGGSPARQAPAGKQTGPAPVLSTSLTWRDVLGSWRARWGIGRMRYAIPPGLYRMGEPDRESPVLVTANYKMTVDRVRCELAGLSVWLLVLDTKGVNVWCAAGKGTFGTEELVRRVEAAGLAGIVEHRNLVLPQLGATGVAAHEVKRATGFSVRYGPVRARDIRAWLAAGMHATPEMRRVTFGWKDRIVLAPMEVAGALKPAAVVLVGLALLDLLRHRTITWHVAADFAPLLAAMFAGTVLVPLLLPWLPSRVFAVKGAVAGAVCAAATLIGLHGGAIDAAGTLMLATAIASYTGMMFTGAATFTNLAGARLEVRRALPAIVVLAAFGAVLRVAAAFV
jgi:hypothetical protein